MRKENRESSIEEQITDNLRRAFRRRAEEDVPEQFLELLTKLREQDESQDDTEK
ncbi:hypothetical protein SAMN04490248_13221 [Salinihabitans flavidus]|uniref:Anti-sigma factor NepR domain-containing protein n=1 Tax=Salinihabitans flavidus TaxID=569882 RepID=A0A1H8VQM1_9RHOB|nr:NepR family anti-sigma factor [Salinihabitans flavidus]SEP17573.1 hypothetical protein SAMN04490248_13221 [Salinihabitans flavidus]